MSRAARVWLPAALALVLLAPQGSQAQRLQDQPVFTPYTQKPAIRDRHAAARALCWHRPEVLNRLRQARPVQLWVFIDVEGIVRNAVVHESCGLEEIDRAALSAARDLEFIPALNKGRVVPVWVAVPIDFNNACKTLTVPVLSPVKHEPPRDPPHRR